MQHSLTVNTAMQERRVWLVLQPARRKAQQKKHGPLTAKPARSTGSRISRLILGERLAKATNDSAERVIRQTGSSVTSLCEALELGSICKGVLQTWARESQFMRLATLFAFSAAAVSALTSGGKEATKRLQVWDSGRRAEVLLEATGVYDRRTLISLAMAAPFINPLILGRTGGDEICRAFDTNPMNGCSMVSRDQSKRIYGR